MSLNFHSVLLFILLNGAFGVDSNQSLNYNHSTGKIDPEAALGAWTIDLRPSPDSLPYLKEIKFTAVKGNRFDGEFYGYPFSGGYFNVDWDKLYFAFTTSDQSGTYFHSGYIVKNKIYGMSLNESRGLFLPWKGVKNKNKIK